MRVKADRVCIVMMSAIGDAVHVLPVLNSLKRANPLMHITWILQPGPAALVRGHKYVDEIILFDRSKGVQGFLDIRKELASKKFDLAICLQVYFKANIIASFVNADVKLGFDYSRARDLNWLFTTHRIPRHPIQHVQDQYLEFCEWLEAPVDKVEWGLSPWNQSELDWQNSFIERHDRPIAAIVVATSKIQKNWMPERWAEVCDSLYFDYGMQPVLLGGNTVPEKDAEKQIIEGSSAKIETLLGSINLRQLTAILDAAPLAISPDTGPLHITVAVDTPVISLIGYSNPKRVGPYRRFHDLMIDAYGEPGEDYKPSMENRMDRMRRITAADVVSKIEHWKKNYSTHEKRKTLIGNLP